MIDQALAGAGQMEIAEFFRRVRAIADMDAAATDALPGILRKTYFVRYQNSVHRAIELIMRETEVQVLTQARDLISRPNLRELIDRRIDKLDPTSEALGRATEAEMALRTAAEDWP